MRAGLLLISLTLLGFFVHSIRARVINTDDDTFEFEESLKRMLAGIEEPREVRIVVIKDDDERVVEKVESRTEDFAQSLREVYGDSIPDQTTRLSTDICMIDR